MIEEILNKLKTEIVVILDKSDIDNFLSEVEILDEQNTLVSDKIRIVKFNTNILTQEMTLKNEIAIRKMTDMEEAEKFVEDRMSTYEKMWDGCGCKVNYYE